MMDWSYFRAAVCCTVVLMAFCASAAGAERVVNIERYAGKLRDVKVQIGGVERKFLFDTGGGDTLISPAVAAAIGCQPAGRILGFRMNGEKFETPKCINVGYSIGSFAVRGEDVGVFDLMTMLPKEFPPLDGLISLASFKGQALALDLAANRVVLNPISMHGQPFPCRVATGTDGSDYTLFAGIARPGIVHWFEVDSGNLDTVRIAPHAAAAFGLDPQGKELQLIDIALGDGRTVKTDARVIDLIHDGALSASFLEQGVLFADLRQRPRCSWSLY